MEKKQTAKNSWVVCGAILLIFYLPYFGVNHLPLHRERIPYICGEEYIPFIAWTSIIYLSLLIQGLIVIRLIPKSLLLKVTLVAGLMVLIHLVTFIIFPIEYARENYESNNLILELFRYLDEPGNCFPSLHVSASIFFACCFGFWQKSKMQKLLMWIWSLIITVSVLTVKQHYLIDVIASILLTLILIILFKDKLRLPAS